MNYWPGQGQVAQSRLASICLTYQAEAHFPSQKGFQEQPLCPNCWAMPWWRALSHFCSRYWGPHSQPLSPHSEQARPGSLLCIKIGWEIILVWSSAKQKTRLGQGIGLKALDGGWPCKSQCQPLPTQPVRASHPWSGFSWASVPLDLKH